MPLNKPHPMLQGIKCIFLQVSIFSIMYILHTILGGWDSVDGIVLHYGLDSPGFHCGGARYCVLVQTGPDQP